MKMILFWVCVFKECEKPVYRFIVGTQLKLFLNDESNSAHLLYIAHFGNMQDAISHKLYLEHLSISSLNYYISALNPKHKDLREYIENY